MGVEMALSEKRKQAIRDAVLDKLMTARARIAIAIRGGSRWDQVDDILAGAMLATSDAAVRAAEGEK